MRYHRVTYLLLGIFSLNLIHGMDGSNEDHKMNGILNRGSTSQPLFQTYAFNYDTAFKTIVESGIFTLSERNALKSHLDAVLRSPDSNEYTIYSKTWVESNSEISNVKMLALLYKHLRKQNNNRMIALEGWLKKNRYSYLFAAVIGGLVVTHPAVHKACECFVSVVTQIGKNTHELWKVFINRNR